MRTLNPSLFVNTQLVLLVQISVWAPITNGDLLRSEDFHELSCPVSPLKLIPHPVNYFWVGIPLFFRHFYKLIQTKDI